MTTPEKIQKVVDYSGATRDAAEAMLTKQNGDVISAIAELSVAPIISGTKYIPPTPVVNDGHDAETKERIIQGRIMADMLSASARNDLRGKASHYPQAPGVAKLAALPEEQPLQ